MQVHVLYKVLEHSDVALIDIFYFIAAWKARVERDRRQPVRIAPKRVSTRLNQQLNRLPLVHAVHKRIAYGTAPALVTCIRVSHLVLEKLLYHICHVLFTCKTKLKRSRNLVLLAERLQLLIDDGFQVGILGTHVFVVGTVLRVVVLLGGGNGVGVALPLGEVGGTAGHLEGYCFQFHFCIFLLKLKSHLYPYSFEDSLILYELFYNEPYKS